MRFFPLYLFNDLKHIEPEVVFEKVQQQSTFSFSYLVLLVGSSIICTLGLLLNAPAVVIGGMIVAPLMWPLVKIAVGIAHERTGYIKDGVVMLFLSIAIGVATAFLITFFSPLKQLNTEIILRTSPTLLDLAIALVSGLIVATALVKPKISDSLAGVAIATSLMPPLCVIGIGLALASSKIAIGSFLLFISNVESIIFASVIVFFLVGIGRQTENGIKRKGIVFLSVALAITAIPLFILLKNFSFETSAYSKVEATLRKKLHEISPSLYVDNIRTNQIQKDGRRVVSVDAEVWLPESTSIGFTEQKLIAAALESSLDRPVSLNLRLQKTLSVPSEEDMSRSSIRSRIIDTFVAEIEQRKTSYSIDSLEVTYDASKKAWVVESVLRGDPNSPFSFHDQKKIEELLSVAVQQRVNVTLEIVSRIKLQSQPDFENQQIKKDVELLISALSPDIDVSVIKLERAKRQGSNQESLPDVITVEIELLAPSEFEIPQTTYTFIKENLQGTFKKPFILKINRIEKVSEIY